MKGTVKWFSQEKGYGFITSESGEDHYFNVQSIKGADLPSIGDKVSFDSKPGNKGPRASNVCILEKGAQTNSRPSDDRINCPKCGKKIVPRMITYRGSPEKSVCPYCAATVKEFSKCFIATAVYGDASCIEVRELRKFRDEKLLRYSVGKLFVSAYYRCSPFLVVLIKDRPWLTRKVRFFLDILVLHITSRSS